MKRRPENNNRRYYDDSYDGRGYDDRYNGRGYDDRYDGRGYDDRYDGRGYDDRYDGRGYDDPYYDGGYDAPYDGGSYDAPNYGGDESWYEDRPRSRRGRSDRGDRQRQGSRSRAFSVILIIMIIAAVAVLGISAYKLIGIWISRREFKDTYAGVANQVMGPVDTSKGPYTPAAGTGTAAGTSSAVIPDDTGLAWDFDALLALCSDAVGYIFQKDIMSYPIVQAEDNDKYLRTMINGEYNVAGTIFVDARCEDGLEGKYSIIYGHNMYSTGMFSSLPDYKEKSYYEEHPYFDVYIGYKHYRYYVFSAFVAEAEGYVYTYYIEDGHYKEQFDQLRSDGLYDTDFRELTEDDHVIILSTCVPERNYDYRNVVCLVRGEEVVGVTP